MAPEQLTMVAPLPPTCWECKKARRSCDGTLPACKKCAKRGVPCLGYGPIKPARFVKIGESRLYKRTSRHNNGQNLLSRPDHLWRQTAKPLINDPFRELVTDYMDAVKFLRERNFCLLGATFLGPTIQPDGPDTIAPSIDQELRNKCQIMSALMHRIRMTKLRRSDIPVLRHKLEKHNKDLIVMLETLSMDNTLKRCASTAATIIYITFWRTTTTNELKWIERAKAAMHIANVNGGWPRVVASNPNDKSAATTFLLNLILANTTSPSRWQFQPDVFAECHSWFKKLYFFAEHPAFPCPWPLLSTIIHINTCRAFPYVDHMNLQKVEISLNAFDPNVWVDAEIPNLYHRLHWTHLVTTIHLAIKVYFISALQPHRQHDLEPLRRKLYQFLQELIPDNAKVPNAAVRFALFWPTIVAGHIADTPAQRNFIRERLMQIGEDMCQSEPRVALDVLKKYWTEGAQGGWDVCFNRPRALAV